MVQSPRFSAFIGHLHFLGTDESGLIVTRTTKRVCLHKVHPSPSLFPEDEELILFTMYLEAQRYDIEQTTVVDEICDIL